MQDARCLKVKPRERAFKQFKSPVLNVLKVILVAPTRVASLPTDYFPIVLFFSVALWPNAGHRHLILEVYRSQTTAHHSW